MKDEVTLEVSLGPDDIVEMKIGGNLDAHSMARLVEWTQKVRELVGDVHKKRGSVLCLVDISKLATYHPDVLTTLANLMKDNEPYVLRTATFGGSPLITMAEDVIVALSGRNNLKAFPLKEDALYWLETGILKTKT